MSNQLYKGNTPLATFAPEVVDNLTTDDSTKALSAKQGKILNDKIDEFKHIEYRDTVATFSNGKATVTHNLGKANQVIPIPNAGLIPFSVTNITNNSFTVDVVWVKSSGSSDSQMATNYSGDYGVKYFLVY